MEITKDQKDFLKALCDRKSGVFVFQFNKKVYLIKNALKAFALTVDGDLEVGHFNEDCTVDSNDVDFLKALVSLLNQIEDLEYVRIPVRDNQGFIDEVKGVLISWKGRKNLKNYKFWEDGEWHYVNRWERDDGVYDKYKDVLIEAQYNGFN